MEKQTKQKPTLFLTKQCWCPRYKVSVLFIYEGYHPEGFIVASFYNLNIANNHYNNNDNDNNNISS